MDDPSASCKARVWMLVTLLMFAGSFSGAIRSLSITTQSTSTRIVISGAGISGHAQQYLHSSQCYHHASRYRYNGRLVKKIFDLSKLKCSNTHMTESPRNIRRQLSLIHSYIHVQHKKRSYPKKRVQMSRLLILCVCLWKQETKNFESYFEGKFNHHEDFMWWMYTRDMAQ